MKISHSPLFEPVLWQDGGFKILDEVMLPDRFEYMTVRELSQALEAVRSMRTRAFGQVLTFLYSGALVAQQFESGDAAGLRRQLEQMTERFCAARPTFDFRGLGDFLLDRLASSPPGVLPGEWLSAQARARAAEIVRAREQRARRTAGVLPDAARVLTHCNVSGELVAVAQFCRELNKDFSVVATETRPYLQGARLTAWELAEANVPVSLIPDCAVAQVMAGGEVNAVVVGSDRCARNGDIINKVGTYPIALLAKQFGVPFYALAQAPGSLARGADVAIEERPADELLCFRGRALVEQMSGLAVRYPAFDVTPAALITNLIGFDDLFTPASFAEKFRGALSAPAAEQTRRPENYILIWGASDDAGYRFLAEALENTPGRSFLVPEMRPALRGIAVARELLRRRLPVTMIADGMAGTLFAHGEIRKVCIFHPAETADEARGDCGALMMARLARAHDVPLILHRSAAAAEPAGDADVGTFLGHRIAPAGASIRPLESEIIPWTWAGDCGGAA